MWMRRMVTLGNWEEEKGEEREDSGFLFARLSLLLASPPTHPYSCSSRRCPGCNWEIVGGMCTRCRRIFPDLIHAHHTGAAVDSQDETDPSSEEEGGGSWRSRTSEDYLYTEDGDEEDEEEGIDLMDGELDQRTHRRRSSSHSRRHPLILGQHSDDEEEEGEEGEESDDSFVVADDCVEMDSDATSDHLSDDEMDEQEYPSDPTGSISKKAMVPDNALGRNRMRRRRLIAVDDDDDED